MSTVNLFGRFVIACGIALAPAALQAAPCAGFTDVNDTSTFCPNVEWLKNRSITLGCTSSTLYCPNDAVNRLQMAAFLNRVANALTPEYRSSSHQFAVSDLDAGGMACNPAAFPVTGFPRKVHGYATIVGGAINGPSADVAVAFGVSSDGGMTYTPATAPQIVTVTGTTRIHTATVLLPIDILDVGTTYRWGLMVSRAPGSSTTGDFSGLCQMVVLIENMNRSTSPFDAVE